MIILFFSRLFYPHIGGVEKHVYEISKELIKQGYKIIVITEQHEKKLKKSEIFEGIKIYRIPIKRENWFKKFDIWFWFWKNRNLIKNADVIHCHDVFFWYLPFRFIFPLKKVFTTFHGYESYPVLKRAIIVRKISEILSFGNICIGEFIKKWYYTNPNHVCYGGVEIKKAKRDKVKKNSAIFIGRLDQQTGIMMYAKTIELIREKNPRFAFTVIGDGKFKKILEKNFTLLKSRKNASEYFYQNHFVFASGYLSILEAMIAKKPIFALYDNPMKKDYLEMSPFARFIVISSSEQELVEKILFFLKNPQKEKEMITNAFNWAKNQTWQKTSEIYLRLWRVPVQKH